MPFPCCFDEQRLQGACSALTGRPFPVGNTCCVPLGKVAGWLPEPCSGAAAQRKLWRTHAVVSEGCTEPA